MNLQLLQGTKGSGGRVPHLVLHYVPKGRRRIGHVLVNSPRMFLLVHKDCF